MANLNNECSCRGENPNCFKCEGTGILTSSVNNYSVKSISKKTKNYDQFTIHTKGSKKKAKAATSTSNSAKELTPDVQITSQAYLMRYSIKTLSIKVIQGDISKHLNSINQKPRNAVFCPLCKRITRRLSEHLVVCLKNREPEYLKSVYSEIMHLKELEPFVELENEVIKIKPLPVNSVKKKNDKM